MCRLISTSFAPPGTTPAIRGEAGSNTHMRSRSSMCTLWTQTNASPAGAPGSQEFHASSGKATRRPSGRISSTELRIGPSHLGKLTNTRPREDTATPVHW